MCDACPLEWPISDSNIILKQIHLILMPDICWNTLFFEKLGKQFTEKCTKTRKKRPMTPLDDLFENHMTLPYVVYQL